MQAVLLAGGLGTRISEETVIKPKPMVEIGGKPILWHIMKIYSQYGVNDFIVCLGYKGYVIKEYFANYFLHTSDVTINLKNNALVIHKNAAEPWKITLVDTGEQTQTGGRLKKVSEYLEPVFCMTYGDGVADIDIEKLIKFHQVNKPLATVTAVKPPGRFGVLNMNDNHISSFNEKPEGDGSWINGGFFVLDKKVLEYIQGDQTIWEKNPMEKLASEGQLIAYRHTGFWQPMDTLRDRQKLEELWTKNEAPWKIW